VRFQDMTFCDITSTIQTASLQAKLLTGYNSFEKHN